MRMKKMMLLLLALMMVNTSATKPSPPADGLFCTENAKKVALTEMINSIGSEEEATYSFIEDHIVIFHFKEISRIYTFTTEINDIDNRVFDVTVSAKITNLEGQARGRDWKSYDIKDTSFYCYPEGMEATETNGLGNQN